MIDTALNLYASFPAESSQVKAFLLIYGLHFLSCHLEGSFIFPDGCSEVNKIAISVHRLNISSRMKPGCW